MVCVPGRVGDCAGGLATWHPASAVGSDLLAFGLVVVRPSYGGLTVEELRRFWKLGYGMRTWQECVRSLRSYPGCQCSVLSGCGPGLLCKSPLVRAVGQL